MVYPCFRRSAASMPRFQSGSCQASYPSYSHSRSPSTSASYTRRRRVVGHDTPHVDLLDAIIICTARWGCIPIGLTECAVASQDPAIFRYGHHVFTWSKF